MYGPAPTPTAIRKLNGNPSRRPYNTREPKAHPGEPDMPRGLTRRAKQEWKRLAEMLLGLGVLSQADGNALGLLCADIAEHERIVKDLAKSGYLLKNPTTGAIHQNPLVKMASDLNRRVLVGLREFGLTPSSRSRVEVIGGVSSATPTESKMADFLKRRQPA